MINGVLSLFFRLHPPFSLPTVQPLYVQSQLPD